MKKTFLLIINYFSKLKRSLSSYNPFIQVTLLVNRNKHFVVLKITFLNLAFENLPTFQENSLGHLHYKVVPGLVIDTRFFIYEPVHLGLMLNCS